MTVEFLELTHHGRGAISVVGVRGEEVAEYIGKCFTPTSGKNFQNESHRSIVYGTWNSTTEDLIVARVSEDVFEVQCHGSIAAVQSVEHDLEEVGAVRSSDPDSWALANNQNQARVARAMESCLTQRTAVFLLRQFHLWGTVGVPDKDTALTAIAFSKFGQRLSSPWTVVICGEPNVGKSSLINALAGYERAIVHATAGTTRDLVTQNTAIDGWPVELTDSAGIRNAGNEIEQAGILKARDRIKSADLVIHVTDATRESAFELDTDNQNHLRVINKIDLCKTEKQFSDSAICISAITGDGLEELQQAISQALVPELPEKDQLVPVTKNQLDFLRQIADRK